MHHTLDATLPTVFLLVRPSCSQFPCTCIHGSHFRFWVTCMYIHVRHCNLTSYNECKHKLHVYKETPQSSSLNARSLPQAWTKASVRVGLWSHTYGVWLAFAVRLCEDCRVHICVVTFNHVCAANLITWHSSLTITPAPRLLHLHPPPSQPPAPHVLFQVADLTHKASL